MLTHEQAAFIRAATSGEEESVTKLGYFRRRYDESWTTSEGDEALAKYDAKYVVVEREHLEELRDTANASYQADKACYDGYPHQMSKLEPTRLAIEHADAVLRGAKC